MRIACPGCSAAYDLPPERVPPGRVVRCKRCGERWTPVPPMDDAPELPPVMAPPRFVPAVVAPDPEPEPPVIAIAPDIPFEPAPDPVALEVPMVPPEPALPAAEAAVPVPVRPTRGPIVLAWLLTAAVLAGAAGLAYARRADVIRLWPPSERAYLLLGRRP